MGNSNNQMIQKGTVSSVEGEADRNGDKTKARVLPDTARDMVTRPLTIPWWLRGKMGDLKPDVAVAYAMFEDGTGIILARMDGEWKGVVPGDVEVGSVNSLGSITVTHDVTASNMSASGDMSAGSNVSAGSEISAGGDVTVGNISLSNHTHTCNGTHSETSSPR